MRGYYIDNCRYEETFENGEHFYVFTGPCVFTGSEFSVKIKGSELFQLRQGKGIACLSNTVDEREFIMSGISPEGWEMQFGQDDLEDDDEENVFETMK